MKGAGESCLVRKTRFLRTLQFRVRDWGRPGALWVPPPIHTSPTVKLIAAKRNLLADITTGAIMTSTRVIDNLRRVEIFAGLIDEELLKVADLCKAVRVPADRTIFNEGDGGDELFVIHEGSVRVMINTRAADGSVAPSTINMLYAGQCFGEMILLNSAARSATVVAVDAATLIVIREPDFRELCDANPRIGYVVIRNLAQDLAYKLRSSNLLLRGNIRWQRGELGKV